MILRYLARVLLHKDALRGVPGFQVLRLALPDLIELGEASEPAAIFGIVSPDEELLQRESNLSHQVRRDEEGNEGQRLHFYEAVRQIASILRHVVHAGPLTDGLDVDAFSVEIENVAAKDRVLADNRRRSDQLRHGLWLRFAIVVHQPHMRAGQRQSGAHSLVKAAGAAGVFLQPNCVELRAAACRFASEKLARRLIRSIVEDHQLANRVRLRVNRLKTSFKKRWTVPCYDDCRHSDHERKSLIYESR